MATILSFTDIHFGKSSDSKEHNELCVEFVGWAISQAKLHQADEIRFLGDWHDSRVKIGIETINYSNRALEMLNAYEGRTRIIIGNHDMPYRESRANHSLPWGRIYEKIDVIDQPTQAGKTFCVPFLVPGDDYREIAKAASQFDLVFGHFELPGFLMNERFAMPEKENHLSGDDFTGSRYVFSGHFHGRQVKRSRHGVNLHYIGNCFPHDFNDAEDRARGAMVIDDSGGDPKYIDWPDAPTFHRVKVSELERVLPALGRRATVKAIPDIELSKKDREDLSVEISSTFDLRKFTIDPVTAEEATAVAAWEGTQDVNAFVCEWLLKEGNAAPGMDPGLLRSLYENASTIK